MPKMETTNKSCYYPAINVFCNSSDIVQAKSILLVIAAHKDAGMLVDVSPACATHPLLLNKREDIIDRPHSSLFFF